MTKRKLIIMAMTTMAQYYDYAIFGLLASSLADNFTAPGEQSSQLSSFFFIFAASVLVRPMGAVFFGKIGDKIGRARALQLATIGMALPTLMIGLLPSYSQIGYSALLLLMSCRMLMLFFLSGETDGVRIYVRESVPKERIFLANGLVTASGQIGALLAALSSWVISLPSMPEHAWRYSFILGGVIGILAFAARLTFQESAEFTDYKKTSEYNETKQLKTRHIIKYNLELFWRCIVMLGCLGGIYTFQVIFLGTYYFDIAQLAEKSIMKQKLLYLIIIYAISAPIVGMIADYTNSRIITTIGLISCIIINIVHLILVENGIFSFWINILSIISMACFAIPIQIHIREIIKVGIAYRLYTASHSIGSMIFSATTPWICVQLFQISEISWAPIAYFIFLLSLLASQLRFLFRG